MATVNKDFKIKNGLIVEGTTGTIDNYDILTKSPDSIDYIIDQVGGSGTSLNTPNTLVLRDGSGNFAAGTINADLTGDVTGTVSDISNHDTDDLAEGTTNKYFSDTLARAALSSGNGIDYNPFSGEIAINTNVTVDINSNQILTNKDMDGASNVFTNIPNGALVNDSITINGYNTDLGSSVTLNTDDVQEGINNKYFSDTLARGAFSAGDGLNYNSANGEFSADLGYGLQFNAGSIEIDDAVVATDSDVSNAITAHDVASGVHGITGSVVGTTDAQTISNKTLGSNLDADGYTITNLPEPSNSTDAATKGYVDSVAEGLHVHASAAAATGANISLAPAPATIDGVTLVSGMRVLVRAQASAPQNGIYTFDGTNLVRAEDYNTAAEVDAGDFIFVSGGSTYGSTGWVQTNTVATLGTDPIVFTQFSGSGEYTAGYGLDLNGTEFSVDTTAIAERSYVDSEIDAHTDLTTGVHGINGDVVGTSDNQTLTNKTLGSGTVLGANLDAVNTYKVTNLVDPTSNQDAATKYYVDTAVSNVGGDLTTHENATTGVHGVTGNIVGTSDSQTLTNKTIDGSSNTISNIANSSLVNDSVTINSNSLSLGGSLTLDTDDISEGTTNKYFTDDRAKDAAGYLLENATQTNIAITYDELNRTLSVVAENGVADSTTNDLAEGTGPGANLYFTDARAVSAIEAVVPNFTEIDVNDVATQIASTTSVATASTVTAYDFAHATYRSGKFLVKAETSSHTQVSEVLVTLDSANNVAVTEYAIVGTNGNLFDVTADVSGADVRIRVETLNNNTDVTVVGTLIK